MSQFTTFRYNSRGGLVMDRDSLHESEGYRRQVDALKQLRNRRAPMADPMTLEGSRDYLLAMHGGYECVSQEFSDTVYKRMADAIDAAIRERDRLRGDVAGMTEELLHVPSREEWRAAIKQREQDKRDAARWRAFKELATAWHKEPLVNAKTGEGIAGIVRWTIWIHEAKDCATVWDAIDAAMAKESGNG